MIHIYNRARSPGGGVDSLILILSREKKKETHTHLPDLPARYRVNVTVPWIIWINRRKVA